MTHAPTLSQRMSDERSNEAATGVLFVDLDYTVIEGFAAQMSDEELKNAELIPETVNLMLRAKNQGIPVVMMTRNNDIHIARFLNARPDLADLFDETVACVGVPKSQPIKAYLDKNKIPANQAMFVDDTGYELEDVESNVKGARSIITDSVGLVDIKKPDDRNYLAIIHTIQKTLERSMKALRFPVEIRRKLEKLISNLMLHPQTQQIDFAARVADRLGADQLDLPEQSFHARHKAIGLCTREKLKKNSSAWLQEAFRQNDCALV